MKSLNFASFASSDWKKSKIRLSSQISFINSLSPTFDKAMFFDERSLGREYSERFSAHFGDHGFAYFSWKPLTVLKALDELNDGDLLFYLDGGCTFPISRVKQFLSDFKTHVKWFSELDDALFGLTCFNEKPFKDLPGTPNATIVKREVLEKFNLANDLEFLYFYPHWQAGIILCEKNSATISFLKRWYQFFCDNYESCIEGGYEDASGQAKAFIHNGSDQAVLQCMLYAERAKVLDLSFIHRYSIIQHLREGRSEVETLNEIEAMKKKKAAVAEEMKKNN